MILYLKIVDEVLFVKLGVLEKIFSVRGSFHIRLSNITDVQLLLPPQTWKEVRMPTMFLPGLVKAGTYFTWQRILMFC